MKLSDKEEQQLNEVEQQCFHGSWTKEMLLEEVNNPLCAVVTAERSGSIVGFALGKIVADEAELYQIGVLPAYRRQHIGNELLTALHEKMRERGAVCCFLEVRSRNTAAAALYESLGYEKISVRKGYYGDDDAVIYKLSFA